MSMLSMGIKMLIFGSKIAAERAADAAGVGRVVKPAWSFADKLAELEKDKGLSADYVKELIKGAKSEQMLKSIETYLVSSRNTLDWKTTDVFLEKIEGKIGDARWAEHLNQLKEQFLANHHDITTALLDHVKELI